MNRVVHELKLHYSLWSMFAMLKAQSRVGRYFFFHNERLIFHMINLISQLSLTGLFIAGDINPRLLTRRCPDIETLSTHNMHILLCLDLFHPAPHIGDVLINLLFQYVVACDTLGATSYTV